MSKNSTAETLATEGTGAERKFVSVNGKPLGNDTRTGVSFVNFKKLNDAGLKGIAAEGIYESSKVVTGGIYGPKTEYIISVPETGFKNLLGDELAAGTLQIITEAGSLKRQMERLETGTFVQILYYGKEAMESGPRKGQLSHKIIVGVES